MNAREQLPHLASLVDRHGDPTYPSVTSRWATDAKVALHRIDELSAEIVALRERLAPPWDAGQFPSEAQQATAVVDAYLNGFPPPFEAWHNIDNAHNDLLREIIKQLVGRWAALRERCRDYDEACESQGLPIGTHISRFVQHHRANAGLTVAFECEIEAHRLRERCRQSEDGWDQCADALFAFLDRNGVQPDLRKALDAHRAAVVSRGET